MKLKLITLVIPAVLALSACTNPNRFDNGAGGAGTFSSVTPGSAQDPQSPLYFQETIGDRVLFDVDQSSLNDEARRVLDGQASWLTTNADYAVVIEGHADERGTRAYNLALGERRANAVARYLVIQGVNRSQIESVSYGEERPLSLSRDENGWSRNRRVELIYQ